MIDDHPMIIEGYKNALSAGLSQEHRLRIDVAHNCDDAIRLIDEASRGRPYDLALIDIQIPASLLYEEITSGDGVASYLKEKSKTRTKIIILTMHSERNRIWGIMKNIDPAGFLIKSDLSSSELVYATQQVLLGKTHVSDTVTRHLKQPKINDFVLDKVNMQILYHLSRGVRTSKLVNYIDLSLSAIEKRKTLIKDKFELKDATDEVLIREARERGFI